MLTLAELRKRRELVNAIDWSMTPERAVEMFLEWGTGWIRGNNFVGSADDEAYYFVIYDWESLPAATLIHRTVEGAEEIARVAVPSDLFLASWKEDGVVPGGSVHPPNAALKKWLNEQIGGPPLDWSVKGH